IHRQASCVGTAGGSSSAAMEIHESGEQKLPAAAPTWRRKIGMALKEQKTPVRAVGGTVCPATWSEQDIAVKRIWHLSWRYCATRTLKRPHGNIAGGDR